MFNIGSFWNLTPTRLLSGAGAVACFGQAYKKTKEGIENLGDNKSDLSLETEDKTLDTTPQKTSKVVLNFLESAAWLAGGGFFSWLALQSADQSSKNPQPLPNPNLEESAFYHNLTRKELETLSLNPFRHAINEQTPLDAEPPVFPEPCFPEAPSKEVGLVQDIFNRLSYYSAKTYYTAINHPKTSALITSVIAYIGWRHYLAKPTPKKGGLGGVHSGGNSFSPGGGGGGGGTAPGEFGQDWLQKMKQLSPQDADALKNHFLTISPWGDSPLKGKLPSAIGGVSLNPDQTPEDWFSTLQELSPGDADSEAFIKSLLSPQREPTGNQPPIEWAPPVPESVSAPSEKAPIKYMSDKWFDDLTKRNAEIQEFFASKNRSLSTQPSPLLISPSSFLNTSNIGEITDESISLTYPPLTPVEPSLSIQPLSTQPSSLATESSLVSLTVPGFAGVFFVDPSQIVPESLLEIIQSLNPEQLEAIRGQLLASQQGSQPSIECAPPVFKPVSVPIQEGSPFKSPDCLKNYFKWYYGSPRGDESISTNPPLTPVEPSLSIQPLSTQPPSLATESSSISVTIPGFEGVFFVDPRILQNLNPEQLEAIRRQLLAYSQNQQEGGGPLPIEGAPAIEVLEETLSDDPPPAEEVSDQTQRDSPSYRALKESFSRLSYEGYLALKKRLQTPPSDSQAEKTEPPKNKKPKKSKKS